MKKKQDGFTILELVIATSVFGVMMLLATTGMIQIGRAYYKGITTAKTEEITRAVATDISDNLQLGGSPVIIPASTTINGFIVQAFCIGSNRYSYVVGKQQGSVSGTGDRLEHVVWLDVNPTNQSGCSSNLDLTAQKPSSGPRDREILASRMRLADFAVKPSTNGRGATISLKVIYGDDEVIDNRGTTTDTATVPATADDSCLSSRSGGQFCAFSSVSTFVKYRI